MSTMKEAEAGFLKRRRKAVIFIASLTIAATAVGFWRFNKSEAKAEYLTSQIERGDIIKTISATGTIQALVTVQVGSQVSGTIAELYADYNSVVRRGQVVARLDPAIFQAQLEQVQANLSNSEASVRTNESAVVNAEANLTAAEANRERTRLAMEDAQRVLKRTLDLQQNAVVSQRDLEAAQAAADQAAAQLRQATAQVDQAKAQLLSSKSQLNQAKAQVLQAKAAVELATVNLSHTVISAPIDGVVVARNVDVGQTVAASLQAPTLFLIANDLTKMQVLANVDEADVGLLGPESSVSFTVDAYPRDHFTGIISQIRLNPQTVQNVVTYTAVIDVDNPELKLKPGMTANVTVTVAERKDVLKVTNAALRYKPDLSESQKKELAALMGQTESSGSQAPAPFTVTDGRARGDRSIQASTPSRQPGRVEGAITGWSTARADRPKTQILWLLEPDNQLQPVKVRLGITDGVSSEIIEGNVGDQDLVVLGQTNEDEGDAQPNSPFGGPFRPRRR